MGHRSFFSRNRCRLGSTALTLSLAGLSAFAGLRPAIAAGAALPDGGRVVLGTATMSQPDATSLRIDTAAARTAIMWNSFSIAAGHTVTINQPTSSSLTLNQVVGADPSQIFGSLKSNGQVVLANPNGIWFGPGAHVDVAAIVASTATASQAALQAFAKGGALMLDQAGHADASVVNDGSISIGQEGLAGLVAPGVANNGIIAARLGRVVLASGTVATLDFYGDGLISFAVGGSVTAQAKDQAGNALSAAVVNSGTITNAGGTVLLTAAAAKTVVDNTINMSGVVIASAVSSTGGEIDLDGGSGTTSVSGALEASSKTAPGGTIQITAAAVQLESTASLSTSGASGGTIAVGGGFHGSGPLARAGSVAITRGATLTANGGQGAGGTVSVWSEGKTQVAAAISAAGTTHGGLIETSGETLDITGISVTAKGPTGADGIWLLDPYALDLDAAAAESIATALASASVTITTTATSLTGGYGTANPNGAGTSAGDIVLQAPITWSSANSLTLNAYGAVIVEPGADIENAGSGSVGLDAGAGVSLAPGTTLSTTGAISGSGSTGSSYAGVLSGATISLAEATSLTFAATAAISASDSVALTAGTDLALPASLSNGSSYLVVTPSLSLSYGGGPIELGTSATAGLGLTPTILSELDVGFGEGNRALAISDTAASGGGITIDSGLQFGNSLSLTPGAGAAIDLNNSAAAAGFGTIYFAGDVVLGADVFIGGGANFLGKIDGTHSLRVAGNAQFGGEVGATTALTDLEVDADCDINTSLIDAATQTYQQAVILAANTDLVGSAVEFDHRLDGPFALTVTGNALFFGDVGGIAALAHLEVTGATTLPGEVQTTGAQDYEGMAQLEAGPFLTNTTLVGSSISFGSAILGGTGEIDYDPRLVISGNAVFDGAVGSSAPLFSLEVSGSTVISSPLIDTWGTQTYTGPVVLGATATTLQASVVTFGSSVDGADALTIETRGEVLQILGRDSFIGAAIFDGVVGGVTPLTSLQVDAVVTVATSAITATSLVAFYDDASLTTDAAFSAAAISLRSVAGGTNALTINAGTGGITASVTSAGNTDLSTTGAGNITLSGLAVSELTIDSTGALQLLSGSYGIGSESITFGAVTLSGDITLSQATTFGRVTLVNNQQVNLTAPDGVVFGSTVDGYAPLAITGGAEFDGIVGGTAPLTSLTVSGNTLINTSAVTTSAVQIYYRTLGFGENCDLTASIVDIGGTVTLGQRSQFSAPIVNFGGPVTLDGDTNITATAVTFSSTIDGAHALTITGDAEFDGVVGGVTPLFSVDVTGYTAMYTTAVTTTAAQDYQGAVSLVPAPPPPYDGGGSGGFVVGGFGGTGGSLGSLTNAGVIVVNTTTTVSTLPLDPVLTGSTISFGGTVDGARVLTIDGNAVFNANVGGLAPLASVEITGTAVLRAVATTGAQTYRGATTLNGSYVASSFAALGPVTIDAGTTIVAPSGITLGSAEGTGSTTGDGSSGSLNAASTGALALPRSVTDPASAAPLAVDWRPLTARDAFDLEFRPAPDRREHTTSGKPGKARRAT